MSRKLDRSNAAHARLMFKHDKKSRKVKSSTAKKVLTAKADYHMHVLEKQGNTRRVLTFNERKQIFASDAKRNGAEKQLL